MYTIPPKLQSSVQIITKEFQKKKIINPVNNSVGSQLTARYEKNPQYVEPSPRNLKVKVTCLSHYFLFTHVLSSFSRSTTIQQRFFSLVLLFSLLLSLLLVIVVIVAAKVAFSNQMSTG